MSHSTKSASDWHKDTIAIHGGEAPQDPHGALVPPMYQTSTFVFDNAAQGGRRFAGEEEGYMYSRLGNPTVAQLEQRVAELEGMQAGAASATGMGAISATMLAFLKQGDHVVASDAIYGCSFALFSHLFERFGIHVTFVDMSDLAATEAAFTDKTQLVFVETPANPHLKLIDIQAVANFAHQRQARLVVDNTFMTPLLQRPAELGADLIVHSATKYLNGHGDVVAGVVVGNQQDIELIKLTTLKDMGATMSAHDAWLILRGLKTLPIRMQRHCENALQVVDFLQSQPAVSRLYFPGLETHPGYAIGQKQMRAAGAIIAFDMRDGYESALQLLNNLKMIKLAVSLGDAETLIQHPASMTHSPLTPEARATAGIGDGLVRLSVGLEHSDDIIADLKQSFATIG
ncbi:methionine gamma-lyase [Aliidiomarina minuta]|uniref:L-methionine gamma-lyase n=1 Tax=Aliidiomarina minuta TaxID=880057 RepID=A0A432W6Z5_9GAMM|nr:methionine gamma-lyase [Aliidiomarina minuta]RUO25791.1 methionine gamma-lyase [Aliidiomarina minuta]